MNTCADQTVAPAVSVGNRPRDDGYYNLLSYIVSNAISGEIMAVENYSEMVPLIPDMHERIEANAQAAQECKHILVLAKLARRLGFSVEKRIVEPQWNEIRKHFSAAVKKKDLAACLIVQDLMTETMAILLYRTLQDEAKTDKETAKVAANLLKDELEHLDIGVKRLKAMLETDRHGVQDALVWAHHRVMPELFSMISTRCHSLCDVLNLDCGSLSLDEIKTDLDTIRVDALQQYTDSLDRVGFDRKISGPLIASMSAYEGVREMNIGSGNGDGSKKPCC